MTPSPVGAVRYGRAVSQGAGSIEFEVVEPGSAEALGAVRAYVEELDSRFTTGFDVEAALAGAPTAFAPPQGLFVLARRDSAVVGCGGVQWFDESRGEIKRMWVAPAARGSGLGQRLLAHLESLIVASGRTTALLDTNGILTEAIALYRRSGYIEIDRYNDNPDAQLWFTKTLA